MEEYRNGPTLVAQPGPVNRFPGYPLPEPAEFYARCHQTWLMLELFAPDLYEEFLEWDNARPGNTGTTEWPMFAELVPGWVAVQENVHGRSTPQPRRPTTRSRKTPIDPNLRWRVFERDGYACQHCGSASDLTADHIFPEAFGGEATVENLQTLCRPCNSRKGVR